MRLREHNRAHRRAPRVRRLGGATRADSGTPALRAGVKTGVPCDAPGGAAKDAKQATHICPTPTSPKRERGRRFENTPSPTQTTGRRIKGIFTASSG